MKEPLVSICCITYNHELYIRDALEGFVKQKTSFPFEVLISDDCSHDGTRAIIAEYKNKYPDLFRDVSPVSNLGMSGNFVHVLEHTIGKYVALCDGDDFWTDPYKLQKQIEILEEDKTIVACFTDCMVVNVDGKTILTEKRLTVGKTEAGPYNLRDFLRDNSTSTLSLVYRNNHRGELVQHLEQLKNDYLGDWPLYICLLVYGDMYYLNQVTCAYRENPDSVTHTIWSNKRVGREKASRMLFRKIADFLPDRYADIAEKFRDIRWTWVKLMFAYKAEKRYIGMAGCLIVAIIVCPRSLLQAFRSGVEKRKSH